MIRPNKYVDEIFLPHDGTKSKGVNTYSEGVGQIGVSKRGESPSCNIFPPLFDKRGGQRMR
jgi:hypothetical protein